MLVALTLLTYNNYTNADLARLALTHPDVAPWAMTSGRIGVKFPMVAPIRFNLYETSCIMTPNWHGTQVVLGTLKGSARSARVNVYLSALDAFYTITLRKSHTHWAVDEGTDCSFSGPRVKAVWLTNTDRVRRRYLARLVPLGRRLGLVDVRCYAPLKVSWTASRIVVPHEASVSLTKVGLELTVSNGSVSGDFKVSITCGSDFPLKPRLISGDLGADPASALTARERETIIFLGRRTPSTERLQAYIASHEPKPAGELLDGSSMHWWWRTVKCEYASDASPRFARTWLAAVDDSWVPIMAHSSL